MKEIDAKQLIASQRKANLKAKKLIRVLGLDDVVVRQNKVIHISPDGSERVLKDTQFKTVSTKMGIFTFKN